MNLAQFKKYINKKNILIALAIFSLFSAINRDINLLYGMFALLSSLLLISFLLSRLMVREIACCRFMNNRATEDEELILTIRAENKRRLPQFMLQVEDQFAAASPKETQQIFLIPKLSHKKALELNYKKRCYKRGEYSIGPIQLSSANPLGLFLRRKRVDVYSDLLVYPATFEIDYLPLVSGSLLPRIGVETMCKAGTSNDFFGTREYKPGDPVKYIHWRSSARLEKIVVKEFELTAATDVTIMIDLEIDSNIGRGKESTLEYAVKIAASIAKYAIARANSVQFIAYGEDQIIIPGAQGIEQLSRILEELARVKANGRIPFHRAIANADHPPLYLNRPYALCQLPFGNKYRAWASRFSDLCLAAEYVLYSRIIYCLGDKAYQKGRGCHVSNRDALSASLPFYWLYSIPLRLHGNWPWLHIA